MSQTSYMISYTRCSLSSCTRGSTQLETSPVEYVLLQKLHFSIGTAATQYSYTSTVYSIPFITFYLSPAHRAICHGICCSSSLWCVSAVMPQRTKIGHPAQTEHRHSLWHCCEAFQKKFSSPTTATMKSSEKQRVNHKLQPATVYNITTAVAPRKSVYKRKCHGG